MKHLKTLLLIVVALTASIAGAEEDGSFVIEFATPLPAGRKTTVSWIAQL